MQNQLDKIENKVDKIHTMLYEHIIEETKDISSIKKDVALHRKLWTGLFGIIVSVGAFFLRNHFE